MYGSHELSHGVERYLANSRVLFLKLVFRQSDFRGIVNHSGLGRVACRYCLTDCELSVCAECE